MEWVDNDMLKSKGYSGYGCMFGHLKMLQTFVDSSDNNYGVFWKTMF